MTSVAIEDSWSIWTVHSRGVFKDLPMEWVPLMHTSAALPLPLLACFLFYWCFSALLWHTREGVAAFVGYLRVNGSGLLWPEAAGQGL